MYDLRENTACLPATHFFFWLNLQFGIFILPHLLEISLRDFTLLNSVWRIYLMDPVLHEILYIF